MPKYVNTSTHPVKLPGPGGKIITVWPNQEVELSESVARNGVPFLKRVLVDTQPEVLQEAAPEPEPAVEPVPEPVAEEETASEGESEDPTVILEGRAKDVVKVIEAIEDMTVLESLLDAEKEGRNRSSVVRTIEERLGK